MFWRKKQARQVELTRESYAWWLRAQRPDLRWFLGLSAVEQESLARLGDEYVQDWIIALSYSVQNPEAAEAGLDAADDVESEEQLVATLARNFAARLGTPNVPNGTPDVPPAARQPDSMGGFGERKAASQAKQRSERAAGRSFLGRAPDEVAE